jgi:charged multivesicular body protein 2A
MAKDLVRTRRYVQKFYQMRTQLQAVGLRIQTLRSNQQMADAMRGATRVRPSLSLLVLNLPLTPLLSPGLASHSRTYLCQCRRSECDFLCVEQAMKSMNRGLNLPQIQRIMNDFERESATMDMKEEMMSDAVDDVMDDDLEDEEEESDKILKQVLDEIGVGISQQVRRMRQVSLARVALVALDIGLSTTTALADSIAPTQLADAPTGMATTSSLTERQPVALADGPAPSPGNTNTGGTGGGGGGGGNQTDEDALQARLDALRRG